MPGTSTWNPSGWSPLVDDILNLSRLDEADVQLEREDFDLSSLARDVAGRLKASAKKNGVVIHGDWRQGGRSTA